MVINLKSKTGDKARRSYIGNMMVYGLIGLLACVSALPLVYALVNSLKPIDELLQFPPRFVVGRPTLDSYKDLFQLVSSLWVPLSRYMFNTLFVTMLGTLGHVLFASMAAYPLAKHGFPGKKPLFAVIVMALMFVPSVTFMPLFILMTKLNLVNTYWALIFPWVGSSLGLFLMKQFIEQIPDQIMEAARIDGSSEFRTFFTIILPNALPAIMTVILFQFNQMWNYTQSDLVFSESLKMVRTAFEQIAQENSIVRMGPGSAATVVLMLPPILLFVLLQRKVVETMTFAGIK